MKALKTGWNKGFPGKSVLNITNIVRNRRPEGLIGPQRVAVRLLINRTTYEQAKSVGFFKFCGHLPQQTDAGFARDSGEGNPGQGSLCRTGHDTLLSRDGLRRRESNRR